MYLSNSRLLSLLLALAVLTLCLLWLLTKQSTSSLASTELNAAESQQLVAKQPGTDHAVSPANDNPAPESMKESAAVNNTEASTPVSAGMPAEAKAAAKPTEVPAIPDSLILSDKELKALSPKERKRYEEMIANLRALHDQSAQLSSERQKLEQQRQELEQRNQALAQQLEEARQKTEAVAAAPNQVKP